MEDKTKRAIQNIVHRSQEVKKYKRKVKDMEDGVGISDTLMKFPEGNNQNNGKKVIFEELRTENFS